MAAQRRPGLGRAFSWRLLLAAAPAYPAGLAIVTLVPAILATHDPDALFVAQAEAVAVVPLIVLIIFGARSLPRGFVAAAVMVLCALVLAIPYLAFGATNPAQ
ncbi:hypothetical protein AA23498_2056 [Acetobacter nitrogenifigens DSM 23921 = NBRC 105050]|uniref:Uncharacterized protein n=2 Tax=Acetobacter TaxID=434 RepID=A0A511X6H1_9PROT|nr:hypothetical protein [Acetobacter nitrogenifigens]MBO1359683.1 hypothetical protein [Acetobacter sacchari]GBQ94529.1 hypothetical protein AA23498_2056 [Acetobacter nitrogenifigens DSM 23921 = NBRC 105050]GEN58548.1 hypothetical protein ANI02nite_04320 [Acetobacter nitrogenifigens DSM 23921 = NBRC 105050]